MPHRYSQPPYPAQGGGLDLSPTAAGHSIPRSLLLILHELQYFSIRNYSVESNSIIFTRRTAAGGGGVGCGFRCQQVRDSRTLAEGWTWEVRGVREAGEVVAVSPNKQAKSAQKCWQTVSISISGEKLMATFLSTFQFIFARFQSRRWCPPPSFLHTAASLSNELFVAIENLLLTKLLMMHVVQVQRKCSRI